MQNLMLNRLAPISNSKNKKGKSLYALPQFLGNFFQVSLKEKNQLVLTNKIFLLIILIPRVLSFYIRTKFRLKNCVTTVHLLQCKTNFFIHLCFEGEIYYYHLELPRDSSSLIYIRLDSSTFVYTRLHSSSNSSVFLEQIVLDCGTFKTKQWSLIDSSGFALLDYHKAIFTAF